MKEKQLLIEIYDSINDSFIKDIDISQYSLDEINAMCPPEEIGDKEYCDSKFVEEKDFEKLKNYITELPGCTYNDFIYNIITRETLG